MISTSDLAGRLYYEYEKYFEVKLTHRRFLYSDILLLINGLKNKNNFAIKKAGKSELGKDIFLVSYGKGKTKIFLWSQMHGNEATATMALFDIFNFLSNKNDFVELKNFLLKETTIYFLPVVNPDGADLFQRRNYFDIDLNRDAARLASKEAKLLMKIFKELQPDFGFNLHDQDTRYSAGNSFKPATISFLAPPVDNSKKMTLCRLNSVKLISELFSILSKYIPGHIAKYSDDYEPRAFGDNFQKMGTSTILIESGGWKNDPEKLFIRKLNFILILSALQSITLKNYKNQQPEVYDRIPLNQELLRDLIIRNVAVNRNDKKCKIDIAVNFEEINIPGKQLFYYKSKIEDLGDLTTFYGYEDHNFSGLNVETGKTFPEIFNTIKDLEKTNFEELYKKGFTNVIIKEPPPQNWTNLPINIFQRMPGKKDQIELDAPANLIFIKDNIIKYVVVNGYLFNLQSKTGQIKNGLIFH